MEWSKFKENTDNWIIKKSQIEGCEVSTVFLGLDHNWSMRGTPILFETMIFPDCEYCERTISYEDSLLAHQQAIDYVMAGGEKSDEAEKSE